MQKIKTLHIEQRQIWLSVNKLQATEIYLNQRIDWLSVKKIKIPKVNLRPIYKKLTYLKSYVKKQ